MANGEQVLSELDFEQKIKEMKDRELLEFTARVTFQACNRVGDLYKDINGTDEIPGLLSRMAETERKQKDNRSMIMGIWGAVVLVVSSIVTLFIQHIGVTK